MLGHAISSFLSDLLVKSSKVQQHHPLSLSLSPHSLPSWSLRAWHGCWSSPWPLRCPTRPPPHGVRASGDGCSVTAVTYAPTSSSSWPTTRMWSSVSTLPLEEGRLNGARKILIIWLVAVEMDELFTNAPECKFRYTVNKKKNVKVMDKRKEDSKWNKIVK